jgi:hypothetical protein
VTVADIVAALKCNAKCSKAEEQWIACPSMLTTEEIVEEMCEGHYGEREEEACTISIGTPSARQSCLHNFGLWTLCFSKMCHLGHKTLRRDRFLIALHSFHKGYWCFIPEIIWRQLHKFWEGVHHRAAEGTRT